MTTTPKLICFCEPVRHSFNGAELIEAVLSEEFDNAHVFFHFQCMPDEWKADLREEIEQLKHSPKH